jgi:hypothetical protein
VTFIEGPGLVVVGAELVDGAAEVAVGVDVAAGAAVLGSLATGGV